MDKLDKGTDLVVSFDTTGSMYPVLTQVRNQVKTFIKGMFDDIPNLRVSVIAHGDYCDKNNPYTIRALDFTSDLKSICEFVSETKQTYGGDADECYELVLYTARTELNWRTAVNKAMVLIGDANPHDINYYDNVQRLDWRREADMLRAEGVKVFAVHALPNFRQSSTAFYKTVAQKTDGTYLTLDQFEEVMDVIKASCMSIYSEKKLTEFVSIIRETGRMTNSMNRNMARLTGEEVTSTPSLVQKDGMISVLPGRFQVMAVGENCAIKEFVENNGITFKTGRGFYELTKHEKVQQYKEVIVQDRVTGEMFTGAQVRERLGLLPQVAKGGAQESLSSRDTSEFRVFVQSTSHNRKLIAGTTFMYEINELDSDEEIKPRRKTKKKETKKEEIPSTKETTEAIEETKAAPAAIAPSVAETEAVAPMEIVPEVTEELKKSAESVHEHTEMIVGAEDTDVMENVLTFMSLDEPKIEEKTPTAVETGHLDKDGNIKKSKKEKGPKYSKAEVTDAAVQLTIESVEICKALLSRFDESTEYNKESSAELIKKFKETLKKAEKMLK